jgi:RNA polymerase sigma-70 factor (ECF subfamily)
VHDAALAEDIVQGVLLRALERFAQLRDPTRARAWIHRMALNAVADHYRQRRELVGLPESLEASEPDPADDVRAEVVQCLAPLMRALPPTYREILEMTELGGLTQQEAAARLGLSLPGAKSRAQRARAMLRERLMKSCAPELDVRGGVMTYRPDLDLAGSAGR